MPLESGYRSGQTKRKTTNAAQQTHEPDRVPGGPLPVMQVLEAQEMLRELKHKFYSWAAYRAAQAGSAKAKGPILLAGLEGCGVVQALENWKDVPTESAAYDAVFYNWLDKALEIINGKNHTPVAFGVAAKLVSVYLKGVLLLHGNEDSQSTRCVHPPIDSQLLKALDRKYKTDLSERYTWQKLSKDQYINLVSELRKLSPSEPLWHLEKHWKP